MHLFPFGINFGCFSLFSLNFLVMVNHYAAPEVVTHGTCRLTSITTFAGIAILWLASYFRMFYIRFKSTKNVGLASLQPRAPSFDDVEMILQQIICIQHVCVYLYVAVYECDWTFDLYSPGEKGAMIWDLSMCITSFLLGKLRTMRQLHEASLFKDALQKQGQFVRSTYTDSNAVETTPVGQSHFFTRYCYQRKIGVYGPKN
jgi:hypothetical protein